MSVSVRVVALVVALAVAACASPHYERSNQHRHA